MAEVLLFDWDRANVDHIRRHRVLPVEIEEVFANVAADLAHENVDGESRWTSVGHTHRSRVLVIVWTMRGDRIRPVTAFAAGKRLAKQFFETRG